MSDSFSIKNDPTIEEFKKMLRFRQLQIDSLLDVTQSINNNDSAVDLLRIYTFMLRAIMNVTRLLVFHDSDEGWICACQHGVSKHVISSIDVQNDLLPIQQTKDLIAANEGWEAPFDMIIPVYHKNKPLAYALVGGGRLESKLKQDSPGERLKFIQTITNIIVVAIENKRLFKKQLAQERFNKEMEVAQRVQSHLVPSHLPNTEQLRMEAIYQPHQNIGGDYYDYIPINEHEFLVCMADISGKGIAAALLMSNVQAILRTLVDGQLSLKELIIKLNDRLMEIMNDRFITFFIAHHNLKTRAFSYVNAGHNPPFLLSKDHCQLLDKGCTILGFFKPLPAIEVQEMILPPDTLIVTYTDGLIDIESEAGEHFEMERLEAFVKGHYGLPVKTFNEHLIAHLKAFKGNKMYTDDISVLSYWIA